MSIHHLLVLPLLALAGCQVISGLTGVSLDGENETECQRAVDKFTSCNLGSTMQDLPPTCATKLLCEAKCVNKFSCNEIRRASKPYLECLNPCTKLD